MTKHLDIKYESKQDDYGQEYVVATMRDLTEEIINITEKHLGKMVKQQDIPARPNEAPELDDTAVVNDKIYSTIAGKFVYLTSKLMLEGINAAREMSKFFMKLQKHHWKAVKQFVGYLKKEIDNIRLTYWKPLDLRFVAIADSNFGMDKLKRRNISGAIYILGGSIIAWTCKTQTRTTLSSTEAEYAALAAAGHELIFVNSLMSNIAPLTQPGILFGDNKGAIALVKNKTEGARTKHIDIRHQFFLDL